MRFPERRHEDDPLAVGAGSASSSRITCSSDRHAPAVAGSQPSSSGDGAPALGIPTATPYVATVERHRIVIRPSSTSRMLGLVGTPGA